MKFVFTFLIVLFSGNFLWAQSFYEPDPAAMHWVDSVYNSLSKKQRIAQLIVVRLSEKTPGGVVFYTKRVDSLISKYNIGSICVFQGGPVYQAGILNQLQQKAQTPLLICIDGETGLGMRLADSVMRLPDQLTMGAVQDDAIIYKAGQVIAAQCKRMGIQVNYAPVVDVNNNASNPVIGVRSFGEDKYRVSILGTAIMRGMQDAGIMACAKHFPGHGDVSVDSHVDLPVINKSKAQLDSLELYPFKKLFEAGVGSVMVAHLSIPAIDATPNQPTTLSKANVTDLLRNQLQYSGISFTDGLEMKGVTKYYSNGAIAVQSLLAGNDMLCLPQNTTDAIEQISKAIRKGTLNEDSIAAKVKKVLLAKYHTGLWQKPVIDTKNLTIDLNAEVPAIRKDIAENALTVLKWNKKIGIPIDTAKRIAYVLIGDTDDNIMSNRMRKDYNASVFYLDYKAESIVCSKLLSNLKEKYDIVIAGLHKYRGGASSNFGISKQVASFINQLSLQNNSLVIAFGNPYGVKQICDINNLLCSYEDDVIFHHAAADWLQGSFAAKGRLPVSVCEQLPAGSGLSVALVSKKIVSPEEAGFNPNVLQMVDSVITTAIDKYAMPGCAVLIAKNNSIVWNKVYGHFTYDRQKPVDVQSVYDLASVTKVAATTLAVMKLFESGKLELGRPLIHYLPWTAGSNKAYITLREMLLHQGGMVAYIPFYKETIDNKTGTPLPGLYAAVADSLYSIPVAENMYLRNDWKDSIYKRILQSRVSSNPGYVYSDNDFIFLGLVVEAVSGKSLDAYLYETFYQPMELPNIHFTPLQYMAANNIVPTEWEMQFREQLIRGYVHDPGAAMMGGVAGHAGLFSNAEDLAAIFMMLLNNGEWNGLQYLKPETIRIFTNYQSDISRRGFGFDKPEKDNAQRKEPYPSKLCSPFTFGHTGFTGTCVWADPQEQLVFVFLSNRVCPNGGDNTMLNRLNVRSTILDTIYKALEQDQVKQ